MTDFENKEIQPEATAQESGQESIPAQQTAEIPQQPQYDVPPAVPQYGVPNYGAAQQSQYNTPQQPVPLQQPGVPPYGTPNFGQPVEKTYYNVPPAGYVQKSRLAAGILAIILGAFGVHNFYLGFNTNGVIQLVVSIVGGIISFGLATAAMGIWALVEGVQILSASSPARLYDGNGVIMRD